MGNPVDAQPSGPFYLGIMRKSPIPQPYSSVSPVLEIIQSHEEYVDLLIHGPEIAKEALPGQFVMIRSWPDGNPLLLRPFDVVKVNPQAGSFRIVFKVSGKGTQLLSKLQPGSEVLVTGPLGRGIVDLEARRIALLARGVGAAAVVYLAEWARARGIVVDAFLSASTADRLVCSNYLAQADTRLHIATDDGSQGYHGDARDLLAVELDTAAGKGSPIEAVFSCGSRRFARYVQELDRSSASRGYIFMEEYMACGMGDCHGCAVPRADGRGYLLVCQEGPVLSAGEVRLE